jgi:hypothetical protein
MRAGAETVNKWLPYIKAQSHITLFIVNFHLHIVIRGSRTTILYLVLDLRKMRVVSGTFFLSHNAFFIFICPFPLYL